LVQNNFAGRPKEKEFEKSIQNLLHHLIVLLLRTEHILQQPDQVALSNDTSCVIIPAHGAAEHDTLQDHVIFRIAIHQLRLQEFDEALLCHGFKPLIRRYVDHSAQQFH